MQREEQQMWRGLERNTHITFQLDLQHGDQETRRHHLIHINRYLCTLIPCFKHYVTKSCWGPLRKIIQQDSTWWMKNDCELYSPGMLEEFFFFFFCIKIGSCLLKLDQCIHNEKWIPEFMSILRTTVFSCSNIAVMMKLILELTVKNDQLS